MPTVIVRTQEELCRLKSYCECNNFKSSYGKPSRWSVWNNTITSDRFIRMFFDCQTYEGYTSSQDKSDILGTVSVENFINNNINFKYIGEIK